VTVKCRMGVTVTFSKSGSCSFSVLNNVPGIMKCVAIIWASERFVDRDSDEDGIRYWRECDSREPENRFLVRECDPLLLVVKR
jgi:hypothetical protein